MNSTGSTVDRGPIRELARAKRWNAVAIALGAFVVLACIIAVIVISNGRNDESRRNGARIESLEQTIEQLSATNDARDECQRRINRNVQRASFQNVQAANSLIVALALPREFVDEDTGETREQKVRKAVALLNIATDAYGQALDLEALYDLPDTPAEPCPL